MCCNMHGYSTLGPLGHKASNDLRLKLSLSHKGKKLSDESKRNISLGKLGANNPMFNHKFTDEHRKKLSESRRGVNNPTYEK